MVHHSRSVFALVVLVTLAGSGTAIAQDNSKPAENVAAADAKSRYPADRNYLKERIESIRRAQNQSADPLKAQNSWPEFAGTVIGIRGMMEFASAGPAITKWIEEGPQGSGRSSQDLLDAAAGLLPDAPKDLVDESERVIDQFNRSSLAKSLDSLVDAEAFVPTGAGESPAITLLLPHLGAARQAARVNAARMSYAARKGDEKELIRAYQHQLALSRACSYDGVVISTLVSHAIDSLANTRLNEILRAHPQSEATLRALLNSNEGSRKAEWAVGINGERLLCLDTTNWVYNSGQFELLNSMSSNASDLGKLAGRAKAMLYAPREEAMAKLDSFFATLEGAMDQDKAVADAAVEKLKSIEKDVTSSIRYTVPALLLPAMSRMIQVEKQSRTFRSGTRIMLAAELHKVIHGSLPKTIDELKPLLGKEPLVDWYDPARLPPRYKLVDEAPGYAIYSVGRDGVDNNGLCNPKNQYGEPNQGEACDYVLNWVEPRTR